MPHAEFVHLRARSAYSLSEGAIKASALIELAKRERMPALALTDNGNLFGALEFAIAAAEAGVQPITGCLLALGREEGGARGGKPPEPDVVLLLAQSEDGYGNLMALSTKAYLETPPGEKPHVSIDTLAAHAGGLILLTGGPAGPVGRLLIDGQQQAAEAMLLRLAAAFPSRLYIEIMRHGLEPERRTENELLDLAYRHNLPLVATNDIYFADAGMFEAHDALLCVADGRYVAEGDRRRLTPEHRFKSAAEMRELFADLPEAIDNTLVVARRCAFMPRKRAPILPDPPRAGGSAADAIRTLAAEGLDRRLENQVYTSDMDEAARGALAKRYHERLEYELGVIVKMGFAGYFLIVADFIRWAKDHGIPVGPGRGSGAGSVVAWGLGITDLDPLRFGLLFERFLNPERISMPDFDIDFCQERRDEVIRYVQGQYGRDRVAQIITFGKLQARAVLRGVGRVLGMAFGHVDRICKLVPYNPAKPVSLQQAIDGEPLLQDMRRSDESVGRLIDVALKLEGLYRHASTHAAGVVIGDRPLHELVALYRDPRSDIPATQFNMKYVEVAGLVKFDFLGLKTLTVLVKALELLAPRGITLDLLKLPLEDKATYEMLAKADTVGVFQLESSGMRDAMRRLKPDRFEDIIALVALYRPGPMENIPKYIACKHGTERPDYLHPSLEGILKETYGVIIYQEQVLQIAQELSGYSLGNADILRKAMGKKDQKEMAAQRKTFIDGAVARGVPADQAAHIFDLVDRFAGYGFNKAHATGYALVSFQTAYLKANYPVEFLAASMTFELGNTDKLNVFRQELDRLKIKLLPPDVNRSEAGFSVEFDVNGVGAVRYALGAIRNVGAAAMDALVSERKQNGPFRDLFDFAQRVDAKGLNKRALEQLVKAGAFDSLEPNRARAFAGIEMVLRMAQAASNDRVSNQIGLFGQAGLTTKAPDLPKAGQWPIHQRLANEFEAIGFYLSAHPLDAYAKGLARLGAVKSSELAARLAAGGATRVKLAGTVIGKQERTSAKGNRFAFMQLSDTGGTYEITVFSELLSSSRDLIASGKPLLITADARIDEESIKLITQQIQPLDDAVAHAAAGLRIVIKEPGALDALKDVLARERKGRGRISVVADLGEDREVEVALPDAYMISAATRGVLLTVPGIVEVQEV
jgi:DNA polymerase III subunit alpha